MDHSLTIHLLSALVCLQMTGHVMAAELPRAESFQFETYRGNELDEPIEQVRMEYLFTTGGISVVYQSRHPGGLDSVKIQAAADGQFIHAEAGHYDQRGQRVAQSAIRHTEQQLQVDLHRRNRRARTVSRTVPDGLLPAGDAGIMLLLRFFPYDTENAALDYFIATFTQHFVKMSMVLTGRETIETPAGVFECHVIEGTVDLFVTKIVTTYWIAVDPPRFLVKYRGRRGLFMAPVYETVLMNYSVKIQEDPRPE